MMIRFICFTLFLLAPAIVVAQVEKRVEVTKAYVPRVAAAIKLPLVPDMSDTVKLRPEINYAITPLSMTTNLAIRPIRPATVTYWEFNRAQPFYLKVGAGYPLNSVLDFYASSQNPGTGYVMGYINHQGQYAKIRNDFREKHNATQMLNGVGLAAGRYLGRHTLEGGVDYQNRLYHRYGWQQLAGADYAGSMADYGALTANIRIGDDFTDLSRLNFEVALHGTYFGDHADLGLYGVTPHQIMAGANATLARNFGRHMVLLKGGYDYIGGRETLSGYRNNRILVGVRYGHGGDVLKLTAGLDYYHEAMRTTEAKSYVIPYLKLDLDLGTKGLAPYLELDGTLRDNSFATLSQLNPYLPTSLFLEQSTVDYNIRFGARGNIGRNKFAYRLWAQLSIVDHQLYWLLSRGAFDLQQARQTITSFHGELEFRPVSRFSLLLGVHGYLYNNSANLHSGRPSLEGTLRVEYTAKKFTFGLSSAIQGVRKWTTIEANVPMKPASEPQFEEGIYQIPFAVDLRANLDWRLNSRITLFAEARNLLNMKLYVQPLFPDYGANCTLGIKMNF